jgi:hypothetical protein
MKKKTSNMHDLSITTRQQTYLVLLLKSEPGRRLIQALHCALVNESISFMSDSSVAVSPPSCVIGQLIRLLHLALPVSCLVP